MVYSIRFLVCWFVIVLVDNQDSYVHISLHLDSYVLIDLAVLSSRFIYLREKKAGFIVVGSIGDPKHSAIPGLTLVHHLVLTLVHGGYFIGSIGRPNPKNTLCNF